MSGPQHRRGGWLRRAAHRARAWVEDRAVIDWGDVEFDLSETLRGDTPLEQAAHLLAEARRVIVFAGSGLSAESGIATFRDKGGMYEADEELWAVTQARTFETRPEWQLSWHQRWRTTMEEATPNAGHEALAQLAHSGWLVITQNVDMLLEHAATKQDKTVEIFHLHGDIHTTRCHDCGEPTEAHFSDWTDLPACPSCGGRLRPGVVWFGEQLPQHMLDHGLRAAEMAQVCLIIGTSGVVYPAASIPETAARFGARLIEVNPFESALSPHCDVLLRQPAAVALPAVIQTMHQLGLAV